MSLRARADLFSVVGLAATTEAGSQRTCIILEQQGPSLLTVSGSRAPRESTSRTTCSRVRLVLSPPLLVPNSILVRPHSQASSKPSLTIARPCAPFTTSAPIPSRNSFSSPPPHNPTLLRFPPTPKPSPPRPSHPHLTRPSSSRTTGQSPSPRPRARPTT